MKNSSTVTLNLKVSDANLLLEALLFASSVNIGANWSERDIDKMVTLSKKLKEVLNNTPELDRLVFYKEEDYKDKWTQTVFESFKSQLNIVNLQEREA